MHKHKLQLQQQQVAAALAAGQGQQAAGTQQATQVQPAQAAQANPQLAAVAAPRPGAVLTGTAVTNLQVARLVRLGNVIILCTNYRYYNTEEVVQVFSHSPVHTLFFLFVIHSCLKFAACVPLNRPRFNTHCIHASSLLGVPANT